MNTDIANIILDYVKDLNFFDKYAGLVRPVVIHQPGPEGKTVRKTFPVACNVTENDCVNQGTYKDLIPNTDYRSIVYFEDNGLSVSGMDNRRIQCVSNLKLVCWLNGKKLGYNGCSISSAALMSVLKILCALPKNINSEPYALINIMPKSEDVKSATIFSKYSYDEAQTQFLMFPFDYFALNIQTTFTIPMACETSLELLDELC